MAKTKAGEGACPVCGERIVWRLSDSGALSCFCQDCDAQMYVKDGTQAKALILKKIGAPAPVSKPETAPQPAPAVEKPADKTGAFGVFGL